MAQNLIRSARGKMVDMSKLSAQNELTPAVGNVRVNARGDELSPTGQIIRAPNSTALEVPMTAVPVQSHRVPEPKPTIQPTTVAPANVAPPVSQPAPVPAVRIEDVQNALKENSSEKSNKGKQ